MSLGPSSLGVLHNLLKSKDKENSTLLWTPGWKGGPLPADAMRDARTIETMWSSNESEKMTGFLKDKCLLSSS